MTENDETRVLTVSEFVATAEAVLAEMAADGPVAEDVLIGDGETPTAVLVSYGFYTYVNELMATPAVAALIAERQAQEISRMFELPLPLARQAVAKANQGEVLTFEEARATIDADDDLAAVYPEEERAAMEQLEGNPG